MSAASLSRITANMTSRCWRSWVSVSVFVGRLPDVMTMVKWTVSIGMVNSTTSCLAAVVDMGPRVRSAVWEMRKNNIPYMLYRPLFKYIVYTEDRLRYRYTGTSLMVNCIKSTQGNITLKPVWLSISGHIAYLCRTDIFPFFIRIKRKHLHHFGGEIRISPQAFRVLRSYISLPLHLFKMVETTSVCLIRIHYLTLFVVSKKDIPLRK